jgi:hypothetical protein
MSNVFDDGGRKVVAHIHRESAPATAGFAWPRRLAAFEFGDPKVVVVRFLEPDGNKGPSAKKKILEFQKLL